MPDLETFSVGIAQRRLLEAIAGYAAGGPTEEDVLAQGLAQWQLGQEFIEAAQVAVTEGDVAKASVLLAVSTLISVASQEQFDTKVAADG